MATDVRVDSAVVSSSPEKKANDVSSIPEGFFDDAKMEFKTKGTVPRSKMDDDYQEFLKSIEAVTKENETLVEQESQSDTLKLQIVENINES